jgi:hypothetical protein
MVANASYVKKEFEEKEVMWDLRFFKRAHRRALRFLEEFFAP